MSANRVPPLSDGTSLACRIASSGSSSSKVESVCQSVARLTPNQSTLPSASTLVIQDTSSLSTWRYLTSECLRGTPKTRPKSASSFAPRSWSRNTRTGCSAKVCWTQARVGVSSVAARLMPQTSVPSVSPSGRRVGVGDISVLPLTFPQVCSRPAARRNVWGPRAPAIDFKHPRPQARDQLTPELDRVTHRIKAAHQERRDAETIIGEQRVGDLFGGAH